MSEPKVLFEEHGNVAVIRLIDQIKEMLLIERRFIDQ